MQHIGIIRKSTNDTKVKIITKYSLNTGTIAISPQIRYSVVENVFEIKIIPHKETISLRKKILRPNQSVQECLYPGDDNAQTFHLGMFRENEILLGIASFYLESRVEKQLEYE